MHIFPSIAATEKPCALFCSPAGKDQPVLLTEKVMDGTSCGQHGLDVCADGRCQVWVYCFEPGCTGTHQAYIYVKTLERFYFILGCCQATPDINS